VIRSGLSCVRVIPRRDRDKSAGRYSRHVDCRGTGVHRAH
jgi:hypothetical protein